MIYVHIDVVDEVTAYETKKAEAESQGKKL